MGGKTVPQRVRMNLFGEACPPGGLLAGMPDRLGIDRPITIMTLRAWKEPNVGFSSQTMPVLSQFVEQLGAEHDIAIFAAFATSDVKDHALAVHIPDFQAC
jgi:hypothetical protein